MKTNVAQTRPVSVNSIPPPPCLSADKPLVSVIVPVFNAEQYLTACLDSLAVQTLREIEILCVNDGSTDGSAGILDIYSKKDSRIRVFTQENKGPGPARNTALDNVKGKYILFCDADDTMEPDAAHECSVIAEMYSVDFVIFNTQIIEVDRSEPGKKNSLGQYISIVQPDNTGVLSRLRCIKTSLLANMWGYLFRSDLINQYHLRFTTYKAGEDGIFLHSYFMVIQTGYALDKIFYNYYIHKGSLTEAAFGKHPWLSRFMHLPRLFGNTFKFAFRNKMSFRAVYVFYWLLMWLKGLKL